ncbi:GerAB/ArcD/ProY family transporter [Paenibacillus montanisoli]|uniref:Spore gernimation protein n=1 Tax=Paenibacillus montanisoli TaxID=2081970 RepID=A0A328U4N4_9BACL|nr:endospore germination permease [Paenibacillus montanisoli]RAP77032.1 spore gernimation protein [Paenibacillus montanisoli]
MLEKGKISSFQLAVVMYPTVLATGFLVLPSISAQYAKNDFWMTGLFALFSGFISVCLAVKLHQLYPKQNLAEYSEQILGKTLGKILVIWFSVHFLNSAGLITRQYAEFVSGNFLFKTPILVIISSIVLLAAFAVHGGAEMIARSAMILTPIFILPICFLVLLIPDLDIKNIFPVLSHGISPVIKGSIGPQAWATQLFIMSFFLPCLKDPQKGKKWAFVSLGAIVFSMVFINFIILLLLGPDSGNKTYPVLTAFRYISFADFFENLEALLLAMWVAGNFIKIAVFYYVTTLSIGLCLNLTDYRPIVFPVGLLIIALSLWGIPNFITLGQHARTVAPIDILLNMLVIPIILLVVTGFRRATKQLKP